MSNIDTAATRNSRKNREPVATRLHTVIGELDLILQLLLFIAVFAVLVAGAASLHGPMGI
jgi:hypothetical protein